MVKKKTVTRKQIATRKPAKIPGLITAVSIIDYIYGILMIIVAVFLFAGGAVLSTTGTFSNALPLAGIAGGALVAAAVFMLILGVIYIILGKAIKKFKLWAKVVQIILAIIGLFSFPIGTIVGIFMLWVLLIKKETKSLFH